jgi:CRP-like cAMP-binding protein
VTRSFRSNEEIYPGGDSARDWVFVVSGAARTCHYLSDGRRRILDFLLPGNCFGFGGHDIRHFAVEAILEPTVVCTFPRALVERAGADHRAMRESIHAMALESLTRAQSRIITLGRVTAPEKLLAFLVELSQRSIREDRTLVSLPMSRYDIADYLAISVETVSRAFATLKRCGLVHLTDSHHVHLAALSGVKPSEDESRSSAHEFALSMND